MLHQVLDYKDGNHGSGSQMEMADLTALYDKCLHVLDEDLGREVEDMKALLTNPSFTKYPIYLFWMKQVFMEPFSTAREPA